MTGDTDTAIGERTERRYDAVFWDIGGVIVELRSVREGYADFITRLAAEHGFDADAALDQWKSVLGDHFRSREGTAYVTASEGYSKATASLFDDEPPTDWQSTLRQCLQATLRPENGAIEVIETLSDAGVTQAIVSDIDTAEAELMLESFGVYDRFDHVTTSEAVGFTKPDERMFLDALEGVGVDPDRTVMVGDRHSHDMVGADAVGLSTAGYGEDASGPSTDYQLDDLRDLLDVVGVDA